ncbi:MAG: hypothetical protein NTW33_00090 [Methanoregula sp.]|jgi:hypothetical protein|nr:hypothetical protein [Methanoregula sp.]
MIQIENAFWFSVSILVGLLIGILGSLFTSEFFRYEDLKDNVDETINNQKRRAKSKTMLTIYGILIAAIFLIYFIIFYMSAVYLENQNIAEGSQNVTIVNNYYYFDKDNLTSIKMLPPHHLSNSRLEIRTESKRFHVLNDISHRKRNDLLSLRANIRS